MPRWTDAEYEGDGDDDPDLEEDYLGESGADDDLCIPCPHCGREILEESERCPHCERYLSREDAPPGASRSGSGWASSRVCTSSIGGSSGRPDGADRPGRDLASRRIYAWRGSACCARFAPRTRVYSPPISAANTLARSAPVAWRVSPFQSRDRPGSNTFFLRNSPTALLPTKLA